MLSSVFVSGRVGCSPFPGYRYIEVDRPVPDAEGRMKIDRFLVKDALGGQSRFMKLSDGSLVIFKGRLETDPEHGLVLVE